VAGVSIAVAIAADARMLLFVCASVVVSAKRAGSKEIFEVSRAISLPTNQAGFLFWVTADIRLETETQALH
jgi:hypothetical protein